MTQEPWRDLELIKGVSLGVAAAGIKYPSRHDLAVLVIDQGASVAGVFTQNAFAAAPVKLCRQRLRDSQTIRAFVVNSGNANACTGDAGTQAAIETCTALAEALNVNPSEILPFSTGVIGQLLPAAKIVSAIPNACENASEDNWLLFAKAIMTTDTRPKGASKTLQLQGEKVCISGVAKGAGMINPNMATMLAFIATDATIDRVLLDEISCYAAQKSFNRISIDGDTSTNDASMLIATGKSKAPSLVFERSPDFVALRDAIVDVYESLAKQIVKDGEGATKFVEIVVERGASSEESLKVAYAIAHSPLVKTAMFACDPNWGRIVAAIGYADVEGLKAEDVRVWLDDVLIVENGGKSHAYTEEQGLRIFNKAEFTIRVDLARGDAKEKLWTSDLSHEYVRINAEYRS